MTNATSAELRVDLWDFEDGYAYAKYSTFSIGSADDKYRLTVDGYIGDAGRAAHILHTTYQNNKDMV